MSTSDLPEPTTEMHSVPSVHPTTPITPLLTGSRVETAKEFGATIGVVVREFKVEPESGEQPDGLIVGQEPKAGVALPPGAVVAVDVVRRTPFFTKHGKGVFATLAFLCLAAAVGLGVVASTTSKERDDLQAQVDLLSSGPVDLANQVKVLTTALESTKDELQKAQTKVQDAEAALAASQQDLAEAQAQLEAETNQVATLTTERDNLLQQVADLQAQLGGITDSVIATPQFVGTQLVAAQQFADTEAVQLVVKTVNTSDQPVAEGTVIEQFPSPGTALVKGSVIAVTVFSSATDTTA